MSRIVSFLSIQHLTPPPPCQFQQFSSRGNSFIFKSFRRLDVRRKATTWLTNFAKILSKYVSRIKTKSQSLGIVRFLNGSCESGHPGLSLANIGHAEARVENTHSRKIACISVSMCDNQNL